MKLTKERCESALKWAGDCFFEDRDGRQWDFKSFSDYKVLERLIEEYFELVDKYYKLESANIGLKQTISNFREKQEKFFKNI